jgi:hypothetical protein
MPEEVGVMSFLSRTLERENADPRGSDVEARPNASSAPSCRRRSRQPVFHLFGAKERPPVRPGDRLLVLPCYSAANCE